MALVEISEHTVRAQADGHVFELGRSLADRGQVTAITVDRARVTARVDGAVVGLRITAKALHSECAHGDCARPSPAGPPGPPDALCAHAVAVALTWLRSGTERPDPDLLDVLRAKDADWLAARLAEVAAGDPELTARLLADAGGPHAPGASTLDALHEDLEAVVKEMTAGRSGSDDDDDDYAYGGSRDYDDDYGEWYPDTEELEEVLDDIEDLLDHAPAAVRELADHAIELLEAVLDQGCYGDDLPNALAHAEQLHLDACLAAPPDPGTLAERLLEGGLSSGWGTFNDLSPYAEILGPDGLARYAALLERARSAAPRHDGPAGSHMRALAESLARAQGGTEAVVELLARTATQPWDFVHLADTLISDGRDDDALEWIGKGLSGHPGHPRLLGLALDCHRRAGRQDKVLELLWVRFTAAPSMPGYLELIKEAGQDGQEASWAARALAYLRAPRSGEHTETHRNAYADPHAALLTQILLRNDDVAAAWEIVQNHRVGHELRMRVAAAYGRIHPEAVIPIYQDLAVTHIMRGSRPAYREAIPHLRTARTLAGQCGREAEFAAYLTGLRAAHPGKKALHQELDQAGL